MHVHIQDCFQHEPGSAFFSVLLLYCEKFMNEIKMFPNEKLFILDGVQNKTRKTVGIGGAGQCLVLLYCYCFGLSPPVVTFFILFI